MMRLLLFLLLALTAFGENLHKDGDCGKDGVDSSDDDFAGTCKSNSKMDARIARTVTLREGKWCVTIECETCGRHLVGHISLQYGPKVAYWLLFSRNDSDTDTDVIGPNECPDPFVHGVINVSIEAFSPFKILFRFYPSSMTKVGREYVTLTPGACGCKESEMKVVPLDGSHEILLLSCIDVVDPLLNCLRYREMDVLEQGSDVAYWDDSPHELPLILDEIEPFLKAFPVDDNDDVKRQFLSSGVITMRAKPGCLRVFASILTSPLLSVVVYVKKAGSPLEKAVAHVFKNEPYLATKEQLIPISFKHIEVIVEFRGPWTQGTFYLTDVSRAGMKCDNQPIGCFKS